MKGCFGISIRYDDDTRGKKKKNFCRKQKVTGCGIVLFLCTEKKGECIFTKVQSYFGTHFE
jgi:hypothetical protein